MSRQHARMGALAVGLAVAVSAVSYTAAAQETPMTFFVTSVGLGDGANLGGLEGADAHCQSLAAAAGRGDATWRAYLSTQGENAVMRARPDRQRSLEFVRHAASDCRRPRLAAWRHDRAGAARQRHRQDDRADRRGESGQRRRRLAQSARHSHRLAVGRDRVHGRRGPYLQQLDEQRRGVGAGRPLRHAGRRQQLVELDPPQPRLQPGEPGRHRRRGLLFSTASHRCAPPCRIVR